MNSNDYWNRFCKTGSIQSYLEYAESAEREQHEPASKGVIPESLGISSSK